MTYPFDAETVKETAVKAGKAIMEIYGGDFAVYEKADSSPVTDADLLSERLIFDVLTRLTPDIPVVGEEHTAAGEFADLSQDMFWLVDPLDGTADFVKRNGEFSVNIALIQGDEPVFGVVYAPVSETVYWTETPTRAFAEQGGIKRELKTRPVPADGFTVLVSRSHRDDSVVEKLLGDRTVKAMIPCGSSIKFCRIADGQADAYPCSHHTKEWDTAAAHAVLKAAGGNVFDDEGNPLKYRKKGLMNPCLLSLGQIK